MARPPADPGLVLLPRAIDAAGVAAVAAELAALRPLWELRYSEHRPLPEGQHQRPLLRPVYWLGNWQFACLGYYEPPKKLHDKAVQAEPFPPAIARVARAAEALARQRLPPPWIPRGWCLNTCLINLYGSKDDGGAEVDAARVGAHQDREPGPVASFSLGERALFQFLPRGEGAPVRTMWLEEGALQVFAGPVWKDSLLHRVGRVEDKRRLDLEPRVPGFRTRRINLTFRFVPPEHIVPYARLGEGARRDVRGYVATLAGSSPFWAAARAAAGEPASPG
jgi:alkylated DNA repair dioxygenase AlkB